jgi:O-antigen/teichoic acid export membrane protein
MSITRRVFSSSAFQIGINLAQRLIGILSTLILARLLTPADFGIIAILALSIHLIDILSDAGSQQYIIQKQDADDTDLNTAWSIDVVGKLLLTAIIWLLAPLIATTLNNPLLSDAIRVVSLSIPIRAFRNPALILLAKELEYQQLFKLGICQKMLSFGAVMLVVAIHPSYWAIVAGDIVAALTLLIGSYRIHPYRPRWSLTRLREQWSFSQWSLLRGITGFGRSQADILIVSKLFPPAALGGYHLQRELALIPAFSLIIPATEPLLSAISKAKHDSELLCYRMRLSMVTLLAILIPLSVFIFRESELIVAVLLGDQWVANHRLLGYFSLMFFAFSFHALVSDCFTAINKLRALFYFDLLSTVVIVSLLLLFSFLTLEQFALLRGLAGLAITLSLLVFLQTLCRFNIFRLASNLGLILLATLAALIASQALSYTLADNLWPIIPLTLYTLVYFLVFAVTFYISTQLVARRHRPVTGQLLAVEESLQLNHDVFELLTKLYKRLRNRV